MARQRVPAVPARRGGGPSRRHAGRQHQLVHGDGPAQRRRRRASACAAMFSLEPATIGGCGYPDLLATGELCDGDSIHDLQHPHDFFMELARRLRTAAGAAAALAGLWRSRRRAGARSGRVSASTVGDAQPDRADRASLARRHAHHVRRRDGRPVWPAVEGGGVGVQRPRARRAPAGTSTSPRSIPSPAGSRSRRRRRSPCRCRLGHLNEAEAERGRRVAHRRRSRSRHR